MRTFRDDIWLWGQDTGSHHGLWNLPGVNKLDSVSGAAYLGIKNCCRVVMGGNPKTPFDAESEKLRGFDQVVWSAMGDVSSKRNDDSDDADEVLKQAKSFPNVVGGVFDDFFRPHKKDARLTVVRMREIAKSFHEAPRPLSLWLVYYAALLGIDYREYLELADVITFWSWTSEELAAAEKNFETVFSFAGGKKVYAGCYLYNYGDDRELTSAEMNGQLELYLKLWKSRRVDGVIVCSNTVADLGFEAVDIYLEFMKQHGNEIRD